MGAKTYRSNRILPKDCITTLNTRQFRVKTPQTQSAWLMKTSRNTARHVPLNVQWVHIGPLPKVPLSVEQLGNADYHVMPTRVHIRVPATAG